MGLRNTTLEARGSRVPTSKTHSNISTSCLDRTRRSLFFSQARGALIGHLCRRQCLRREWKNRRQVIWQGYGCLQLRVLACSFSARRPLLCLIGRDLRRIMLEFQAILDMATCSWGVEGCNAPEICNWPETAGLCVELSGITSQTNDVSSPSQTR